MIFKLKNKKIDSIYTLWHSEVMCSYVCKVADHVFCTYTIINTNISTKISPGST